MATRVHLAQRVSLRWRAINLTSKRHGASTHYTGQRVLTLQRPQDLNPDTVHHHWQCHELFHIRGEQAESRVRVHLAALDWFNGVSASCIQ